jgi:hypothetical protein
MSPSCSFVILTSIKDEANEVDVVNTIELIPTTMFPFD